MLVNLLNVLSDDKPHLSKEKGKEQGIKIGTPLRFRVKMWKGRPKCIAGIKKYALEKQINFLGDFSHSLITGEIL